ncbi:hypothetical protein BCR32DRAFT_31885 [Anaeromyces robustus]|uniref:Uncharacterized protein n=1 Tax=Anaeromyces robustus TaxID=1754192 RepID=A0A1Y1XLW6_9FUNG|nr:hypothetical protein BCR32DRAFT_31885 [Anaeromyces robustus]|eukprot:ORX86738.1 hypothetical protein BCR32DRAFT_31885 [Anaeromyces robustus]
MELRKRKPNINYNYTQIFSPKDVGEKDLGSENSHLNPSKNQKNTSAKTNNKSKRKRTVNTESDDEYISTYDSKNYISSDESNVSSIKGKKRKNKKKYEIYNLDSDSDNSGDNDITNSSYDPIIQQNVTIATPLRILKELKFSSIMNKVIDLVGESDEEMEIIAIDSDNNNGNKQNTIKNNNTDDVIIIDLSLDDKISSESNNINSSKSKNKNKTSKNINIKKPKNKSDEKSESEISEVPSIRRNKSSENKEKVKSESEKENEEELNDSNNQSKKHKRNIPSDNDNNNKKYRKIEESPKIKHNLRNRNINNNNNNNNDDDDESNISKNLRNRNTKSIENEINDNESTVINDLEEMIIGDDQHSSSNIDSIEISSDDSDDDIIEILPEKRKISRDVEIEISDDDYIFESKKARRSSKGSIPQSSMKKSIEQRSSRIKQKNENRLLTLQRLKERKRKPIDSVNPYEDVYGEEEDDDDDDDDNSEEHIPPIRYIPDKNDDFIVSDSGNEEVYFLTTKWDIKQRKKLYKAFKKLYKFCIAIMIHQAYIKSNISDIKKAFQIINKRINNVCKKITPVPPWEHKFQ